MKQHPLMHLVPASNAFNVSSLRSSPETLTNTVEAIYDSSNFDGCFNRDP